MKQRLMRPTAALFPAVLAASCMLGATQLASRLMLVYFIMQLFSLCATDSFRNAAAREPGVKRVDRRFSGTFLQMIFGLCLGAVASSLLFRNHDGNLRFLPVCGISACIIIEQLFEERMFALSHPHDGVILSVISNLLLLMGLQLDAGGGVSAPFMGFYSICAAGLGMVIAIITCYGIEPMHAFSLKPIHIGFFPKAAVQSLLYLPLAIALCGFQFPVFVGWMLWRLSRTVCRRSLNESWALNALLTAICAALLIASGFVEGLHACAAACMLALLCAEAVYCAPGWRLYVGTALLIGGWAIGEAQIWMDRGHIIVVVLALIAAILNLHRAFLRKV